MSEFGWQMSDEDPTPTRPVRARGLVLGAVSAAVAVALAVVAVARLGGSGVIEDYVGAGQGETTIEVVAGDSLTQIAQTLAEADVVASSEAFLAAVQNDPRALSISPGFYLMRSQMSAEQAFVRMLDPASRVVIRLVIPEGLRADRVATLIAEALDMSVDEVLDEMADVTDLGLPRFAPSVEGFLFPATYEFPPDITVREVLRTVIQRFAQAQKSVDLVARAAEVGRTPLEIVTIASIIEAEVAPADFGKASRVIYNRLERGIRLQMDSTVNYALGSSTLQFTPDELATDNPYNTYVIPALPPGPIGSPGQAAMEAALSPEAGAWLWFVSVNPDEGLTKFASTEAEFFRYRAEFQAWYRENR